ncbi:MAG: transposase [Kiritimatiellia bacterium]
MSSTGPSPVKSSSKTPRRRSSPGSCARPPRIAGSRILTHVVMSNHYHILIEVPVRKPMTEAEVLQRVKAQVSAQRHAAIVREIAQLRKSAGERAVAIRLKRITDRMYSLSGFMHALNQAMSEWYNRTHHRFGPLWSGRFKSVIVEGDELALLSMATYIDLNPVRAGIVPDPKDYRWCGYGEAVAGQEPAQAALTRLLSGHGCATTWAAAAPRYRELMFVKGEETGARRGLSRAVVVETLARGGELTIWELLHCRIRYLTDGVAFGSRAFLDEVFAGNRGLFGKRRATGPRPMKGGAAWQGLMTLRDLRLSPIS